VSLTTQPATAKSSFPLPLLLAFSLACAAPAAEAAPRIFVSQSDAASVVEEMRACRCSLGRWPKATDESIWWNSDDVKSRPVFE
jgi:hypothetical protein